MIHMFTLTIILVLGAGLTQAAESQTAKAVPKETIQPEKHDFFFKLPWFGQIRSSQSITLTTRIAGTIVSLGTEDGALVQSGDLLFTLGGDEIESRRIDLEIQFESAKQNLELAKKNVLIRQSLLNEHLSSKELLNTAEQIASQAAAQLSASKQALTMFASNTNIRSPIQGRFTSRAVSLGQYVSLGSTLAKVVSSKQRIQASLFPPMGMPLKGLQARIHGTPPNTQTHAVVQEVFPNTDASGAVQIWINGAGLAQFPAGAAVSGELIVMPHHALAIPYSAIARNEQGQAFVFIQTPQGFEKQAVQTGLRDGHWIEIRTGLKGNERLLSQGAYELLYKDFSKTFRVAD